MPGPLCGPGGAPRDRTCSASSTRVAPAPRRAKVAWPPWSRGAPPGVAWQDPFGKAIVFAFPKGKLIKRKLPRHAERGEIRCASSAKLPSVGAVSPLSRSALTLLTQSRNEPWRAVCHCCSAVLRPARNNWPRVPISKLASLRFDNFGN